jgi:hypothetical protein
MNHYRDGGQRVPSHPVVYDVCAAILPRNNARRGERSSPQDDDEAKRWEMLRNLPHLGSAAQPTPDAGASGSIAGRQFILIEVDGTTFDLMERFAGLKVAKWRIGRPLPLLSGKLLRLALAALLREAAFRLPEAKAARHERHRRTLSVAQLMRVRGRCKLLVERRILDASELGERAIKLCNLGRQREHDLFQIRVELIREIAQHLLCNFPLNCERLCNEPVHFGSCDGLIHLITACRR